MSETITDQARGRTKALLEGAMALSQLQAQVAKRCFERPSDMPCPAQCHHDSDLRIGVGRPEWRLRPVDLAAVRPIGHAYVGLDDPPDTTRIAGSLGGQEIAVHVYADVQIRPLQAVKVGGQGIAIIDNADGDVGLTGGEIDRLVQREQLDLDIRVEARNVGVSVTSSSSWTL